MLYDLGVLALFVTLARSHVFRIGFRTRTVYCGDRGASSFAVGHGTTCIYPVVVGEMHLHSHPTVMIWPAGFICIFFRLEARTEMADCGKLGLS